MQKENELIFKPENFFKYVLDIEPHPKQLEVLRNNALNKILCAGRRSGKTKLVAGELFRGSYSGEYQKQIAIAPTYKQSKIIYAEILDRAQKRKLMHVIKRFVEHPYPQISFVHGAFIDFASADNPDSMRGSDYGRLFVDEAGLITPKGWRAIRPMGFDTGAPMWQTSTPFGKNDFYYDYQRGLEHSSLWASFHFSTFDNPYISKEAVQREVDEYGESSVYVQTEIYGNFVEDVDLLFPVELVRQCVDENLEMVAIL